MTEQERAERFSKLRCIPHAEITYTHTTRTQEIEIKVAGQRIASKLKIFKRGKCIEEHYCLTDLGITYSNP